MAYEIIQKGRRSGTKHTVTITNRGLIIFNAACAREYLKDSPYLQVLVDRDSAKDSIRVAFLPTTEEGANTFSVVKSAKGSSAAMSGRSVVGQLGLKTDRSQAFEALWVERAILGRKQGVLEIEVERAMCEKAK